MRIFEKLASSRRSGLLLLLATLTVSAFCASCGPKSPTTQEQMPGGVAASRTLSDATTTILKSLEAPVEIRFYSSLDPASTSEALRAFAGRADQLLAAFELQAAGKISLRRYTNQSDVAAATVDGVRTFNLDKGDACFLGVAVIGNGRKEIMEQLSPEWETALESDLSRLIARVVSARNAGGAAVTSTPQPDVAVVAEIKKLIPDLGSVSLAEGKKILQATALKEIKEATIELQQRMKEAQERAAQNGNSETERQAALKQLQELRAEQAGKLKELAGRTQARIQALEQMKAK